MGKTRDTGFLRNLLTYDANGNITTTGTLSGPAGAMYATQSYVGTQVATKLSLSGGTLTGDLTLGSGSTPYIGNNIYLRGRNVANSAYKAIIGIGGSGSIAPDKLLVDPDNNGSVFGGSVMVSSSVTASGGLITKGSSLNVNNSLKFLRADGTEMAYIGWSTESANNSTWLFKSSNGNSIALSADGINQQFIVNTSGNVGISTTSPTGKLHVVLPAFTNEDTDSQQAIFGSGTAGYGVRIGYNESNSIGYIYSLKPSVAWSSLQFAGNNLIFCGGGSTEAMRINGSRNVLIGTTSDSGYPFIVAKARDGWQAAFVNVSSYGTQQVFLSHGEGYGAYIDSGSAGNSSSRYIFKAVSGGSARFTVRGDGNVGIGTESPSHRLQVSGNIYSTDTVFGRNIKPEAFVSVSAGSPSSATIPYGYSMISISTPCDGNWRSILSNINDTKAYFWASIGDAASKDTANYFMSMTSPAYGVYNFGVISYQDNGWNTGSFEFSYDNSGNGTHRLLVRATSYYNSGGTAYGNIYFLRIE